MKNKTLGLIFAIILPLILLCACSSAGEKPGSISVVYIITSLLSLLILLGYFISIKKRDIWFVVLFISIFVVNAGYFLLSVSETVEQALMYNRLSYLGSVFLPLSMIMSIFNVTKLQYKKWLPGILMTISILVFFVAASPGYLDIYYKSVTLEKMHGISVLKKVYGPWHSVYMVYLIGYFSLMSVATIHAISVKKIDSPAHAIILVVAVFVNICVWVMEKFVKTGFSMLSVSYIISEAFLLSLSMMIQHQEVLIASIQAKIVANKSSRTKAADIDKSSAEFIEQCNYIKEQLIHLTASEKAIYNCYLEGKSTKEVMQEMSIAENTLKFHNKNIYSKLGVSSRKQLMEYAREIEKEGFRV